MVKSWTQLRGPLREQTDKAGPLGVATHMGWCEVSRHPNGTQVANLYVQSKSHISVTVRTRMSPRGDVIFVLGVPSPKFLRSPIPIWVSMFYSSYRLLGQGRGVTSRQGVVMRGRGRRGA
jgi:hypothetical protein